MKISRKRKVLVSSFIAILFSILTFTFTTFAWFSDSISSSENIITMGNLDVEMYWSNDLENGNWNNIEDPSKNTVFSHGNYEPGYTDVKYLKIVNAGSLAFKYDVSLLPAGEIGELAEVVDLYYLYDAKYNISSRSLTEMEKLGTIKNILGKSITNTQVLLPKYVNDGTHLSSEVIIAVALKMQTSAGNEYKGKSLGDGFSIRLVATQYSFEGDSFGKDFDDALNWPNDSIVGDHVTSLPVESTTDNKVAKEVKIANKKGNVNAVIPAGVLLDKGTNSLTLSVAEVEESKANVTLNEAEAMLSMDVHIGGVSKDNNVVIAIAIDELLPKGLNLGNYKFYHVEGDETIQMTLLTGEATPVHNSFSYDPITGNVVVYLKSFSEVSVVADTEMKWEGGVDYSWYSKDATEYLIANGDQLNGLAKIVGGMAEGIDYDDFICRDEKGEIKVDKDGKTVRKVIKLVSDINLADKDNASSYIFYPIGYHYDEKTGKPYSTVYQFSGVFDGNGHTIANFYQNTWEIKGDYDANYYKDAMGLFGYIVDGEVANLRVDSFSSDGEFTPTGVIAAYAENSTFLNISIVNCNPRVYNTGNGGIVGVAGNSGDTTDKKLVFTNITVDNSNKISALWGSWDVACGGLMGMFRGNGLVDMKNCHVAAQIDVYNDVCGNYQYYWYRYAGMIIGSIRGKNIVDDKGYTVPNTAGITATDCTVHFGDWNDYYYCELVANSLASYTHDHQFSRLTEVKSVNLENKIITPLEGEAYPVPTSGRYNYVVVTEKDETKEVTCYHFVNGEVWDHETAGTETVNGKTVLKEDKQAVYLPFKQIIQGDGWGVKHLPVYDDGKTDFAGITILDREIANSQEKFASALTGNELNTETTYYIGNLFSAKDNLGKNEIYGNNVRVTISPVGENSTVSGVYTANPTDWTQGTLRITGVGPAKITITDYKYCTPTTIDVVVKEVDKFITKFTDDFTYRIGNKNAVELGLLFTAKEGKVIDSSSLDVTMQIGDYRKNEAQTIEEVADLLTYDKGEENKTDWTKYTIDINDDFTGVITLTIKEKHSNAYNLVLEVVDAVNATGATNATSNNVVLLKDCDFSSLEVFNGYTLYGNGFTMTCGSDSAALDMGYSFVKLDNGTLDNVQIVCPNFDYAVLYKENMTESGNRSQTTDKTRYYNVKSGVMVSGNSQILNSRISGARAAVNITGGNVLIDNSRIELGAVANILVGSANSVTLRDVTLVQKPTASTHNPNKTLMGFSTLFVCDADGNTAPVTLEGTFVQNAWVNESDKQYVPSAGESIISTVLGKTDYLHDLDGDGTKESLNLGFAYMPESLTSKVNTTTITDNRTNKNDVPYDYAEVSILNGKTYVYSYKNINGTADSFKTESDYTPNKYGDIITVNYSDTAAGLEQGKSFGTNGWVYELNVDLDKAPGYTLDFSKLSLTVNGTPVTDYKVNGSDKPSSPVAVTAGGTTYELTATIDGKEYTATFKVTGTETSKESPSKISGPTAAGFGVAKSYGGDWSGAADVLTGVKVKYWSVAENKYVEFDFSNFTVPGNAGKLNGTNSYWEYTHTNNDFTLKVTNTVAIHSGKSVYGMPIRGTDGKLYFTISSTNGYVGSGTTSRAVTMQYEFTDNNGGEKLTFTHTFNISYQKDDQYSYSDLSGSGKLTKLTSSGGGSSSCITPDSLITLADGRQVRVDSLLCNEQLLVWNLETGKLDSAPIMFIDNDPVANYKVVNLHFSDETIVKVIYEHGFWDYNLGKYVYLDENASEYIGHWFAKQNGDNLEKVQLVDVVIEEEMTSAWSPVTVGHLCYFVNGMLSMPGGVEGLFNIFDVNPETMTYDYEAMQRDIETYGLFTYEEVNEIAPLSREMFEQCGGAYLKVSIGKGNMTIDDLIYMIERYKNFYTSLVALGLIL